MVNTDPRYLEAGKVLRSIVPGTPVKLYKTTRAGATSGLCANAIDLNEPFCLIAPTKTIAHETIIDSEKYANRKGAIIKRLVSNHDCLKIQEKIERYPDLNKLPVIPLQGYCTKCELRDKCKVTEFIRADRCALDGVGMTYHKLMAIVLSESQSSIDILEKLTKVIKLFVFDEAHYFETPSPVSIQIYPKRDIEYLIEHTRDNTTVQIMLNEYKDVLASATAAIEALLQNKEDHKNNRMALSVPKQYDVVRISKGIKEVVDLMINRSNHNLSVEDVIYISQIIMIMAADDLVVHYLKVDGDDRVQLSARDGLYLSTRLLLEKVGMKKVIFTSATFGDFNYKPLFEKHTTCVMKDTMESNSKMIIFPDTFMINSINAKKRESKRIIDTVAEYAIKYPNIRFVCMKKKMAQWIEKSLAPMKLSINVDYYRSDQMLGVENSERECVCVGAPTSPINAHDAISFSFDESQKKRVGENHAAFWQAISRFKDPMGNKPSYIHCIGITEKELTMMTTWGTEREIVMNRIKCEDVNAELNFSELTILSTDEMKILRLLQGCDYDISKMLKAAPRRLKQKNIIPMVVHFKELGLLDKRI